MTECGQRIKITALLRKAFFEPVSDLRRSPQFAKAEKKRIGGEVRKFQSNEPRERKFAK